MHRLTALQLVFIAATFDARLLVSQSPCHDEGKHAIDDLLARWSWELFWDGETSGFRYHPRAKAKVNVFWNAELTGMCSVDLGLCTAYERGKGGLRQFRMAENFLGRKDLYQVSDDFLRNLGESRSSQDSNAYKPGSERRFEGGGTSVLIPTPSGESAQAKAVNVQSCLLSDRRFPPLGPPRPIRSKITPNNIEAFKRWLQGRLQPGPVGTKSEYVIPYYDPSDPMIYVLVITNGKTESVVFAVPRQGEADWRIGGHFDAKESTTEVERLEHLIRSSKLTSVYR